jgi:hypothetical protein
MRRYKKLHWTSHVSYSQIVSYLVNEKISVRRASDLAGYQPSVSIRERNFLDKMSDY